jgi:phage gp36-like protein
MSWITLTEAQFLTQLTGAETSALKTAALAAGQGEPLTETLRKAVQLVRGYISGNSANKLGEGDTIPQELESAAIAIARYSAINRLPVKSLLTEGRVNEYRDALSLLKDVAAGRFKIEQPATPSTQIISGPGVQVVTSTCRKATRQKLSGL